MTSTKAGSRLAAQTAARWPVSQIAAPAIHRRRPSPTAAASVPLTMATAGGAAEQDRLGERAMDGRVEPGIRFALSHQTSTPPPNWKNERKKLDAAKAID